MSALRLLSFIAVLAIGMPALEAQVQRGKSGPSTRSSGNRSETRPSGPQRSTPPSRAIERPRVETGNRGSTMERPRIGERRDGQTIERPRIESGSRGSALERPNIDTRYRGSTIERPRIDTGNRDGRDGRGVIIGGSNGRTGGQAIERPRLSDGTLRTEPSDRSQGRGDGGGIIRGGNSQRPDNYNFRSGRDRDEPVRVGRAPIDRVRGNRVSYYTYSPVYHYGYVSFGNGSWSLRVGYTHYDYRWSDRNWFFRHYVYDPCVAPAYVSPWYYYPHLPAYLSPDRCRVITYRPAVFYGSFYEWNRPSLSRYDRYTDLDYALEDIVSAFERNNRRAKNRLMPSDGSVHILVDGDYAYSLLPNDFEEMFEDAIESTRTVRYEIVSVRNNSREASVVARHEYEDPWGARRVVWHTYRLESERGGAVIREFGVSDSRP